MRSLLADEPLMADLVAEFAAGLKARVAAMDTALGAGDLAQLRTLAHRLKGAAGSYGFPPLTALACELERAARTLDAGGAREALEALTAGCADAAATTAAEAAGTAPPTGA